MVRTKVRRSMVSEKVSRRAPVFMSSVKLYKDGAETSETYTETGKQLATVIGLVGFMLVSYITPEVTLR